MRTVRLLPYGGEGGGSRRALDSVLVAIVCVYMVQEGWEIFKAARDDELLACATISPTHPLSLPSSRVAGRYVRKLWNLYDLVNIVIFWAAFGLRNYVHSEILAMKARRANTRARARTN